MFYVRLVLYHFFRFYGLRIAAAFSLTVCLFAFFSLADPVRQWYEGYLEVLLMGCVAAVIAFLYSAGEVIELYNRGHHWRVWLSLIGAVFSSLIFWFSVGGEAAESAALEFAVFAAIPWLVTCVLCRIRWPRILLYACVAGGILYWLAVGLMLLKSI